MKKLATQFLRVFLAAFLMTTSLPWNSQPLFAAKGDVVAWPDEGASRTSDILRIRGREDGSTTNFVAPGADNTYSLGTSSLRFSSGHIYDLTAYDDLTVSGDIALTGLYREVPTSYTIGTATAVAPTSSLLVLLTTGSVIAWSLYPSTAGLSNGTIITLFNGSTNTITFTPQNNFQLSTGTASEATRSFNSVGDMLSLLLYNTTWFELNYSTT